MGHVMQDTVGAACRQPERCVERLLAAQAREDAAQAAAGAARPPSFAAFSSF